MKEHSKLPWFPRGVTIILDKEYIADVSRVVAFMGIDSKTGCANAKFASMAANMHGELVETVEILLTTRHTAKATKNAFAVLDKAKAKGRDMKDQQYKYKFRCNSCGRKFTKIIGKDVDKVVKCRSCRSTNVVMLAVVK